MIWDVLDTESWERFTTGKTYAPSVLEHKYPRGTRPDFPGITDAVDLWAEAKKRLTWDDFYEASQTDAETYVDLIRTYRQSYFYPEEDTSS